MTTRSIELQANLRLNLRKQNGKTPASKILEIVGNETVANSCFDEKSNALAEEIQQNEKPSRVHEVLRIRRQGELDVEARKTNATDIAMSVHMNWKLKPWYKMELTKEQEELICEWWSGKLAYHHAELY